MGNVTFDWKHQVWEDREQYLYDPDALRTDKDHDFHARLPDVLVTSTSLHPCWHTVSHDATLTSLDSADKRLGLYPNIPNEAAVREFRNQLPMELQAIRKVYQGPLLWFEAGDVEPVENYKKYSECITSFNNVTKMLAGSSVAGTLAVVKRQQIERIACAQAPKKGECDKLIHKSDRVVQYVTSAFYAALEHALSGTNARPLATATQGDAVSGEPNTAGKPKGEKSNDKRPEDKHPKDKKPINALPTTTTALSFTRTPLTSVAPTTSNAGLATATQGKAVSGETNKAEKPKGETSNDTRPEEKHPEDKKPIDAPPTTTSTLSRTRTPLTSVAPKASNASLATATQGDAVSGEPNTAGKPKGEKSNDTRPEDKHPKDTKPIDAPPTTTTTLSRTRTPLTSVAPNASNDSLATATQGTS